MKLLKYLGFIKKDDEPVYMFKSTCGEESNSAASYDCKKKITGILPYFIVVIWIVFFFVVIHRMKPVAPTTSITEKPGYLAVYHPYDPALSNPEVVKEFHFNEKDFSYLSQFVIYTNGQIYERNGSIPAGFYIEKLQCVKPDTYEHKYINIIVKIDTDEASMIQGTNR